MREIKFRAFHKQVQKMYDVAGMFFNFVLLVLEKDDKWVKKTVLTIDIQEVELMQYTGIKDKNGTEVYEGDIIRAEEDGLGVIKYGVGCFYYEDDWNGRIALEELTDLMVVIGNVYQHNHLLPEDSDN